ncbi:hypothetical protein NHP200010_04290 [Helicobacter bizzozeronii]|uniref:hypothetical protein n=1 Tax=Helicobacter bizzozeronii TaxID=56877 RepID=UPI00244D8E8D|nr:hypothetical protein [Helicobacter bizzozeronii]GMB92718.1 hypothetical protein NHP200010_04290 [Helicobacter bizzozeronii]
MERTKTIKGIYLTQEHLETEINASWKEFENNDNLSNPKHSFNKHISACFESFKQSVENQEVVTINATTFYLSKEQVFGFVYRPTGSRWYYTSDRYFILTPLHALMIEYADGAYHDVKFNQNQAGGAIKSIYPKLPILRHQDTMQSMQNIIRIHRNDLEVLDNSCSGYMRDWNYYWYLGADNTLDYAYMPNNRCYWHLDLVPASPSLKKIFKWLYTAPQSRVSARALQTQWWLKQLKENLADRVKKSEDIQSYIANNNSFSRFPTDQKNLLTSMLEAYLKNKEQGIERAVEQAYQQAMPSIAIQFPTSLTNSRDYAILKAFEWNAGVQKWTLQHAQNISANITAPENYFDNLIQADAERAAIKVYDPKILTDANRGLWELWEQGGEQRGVFVPFKTPAVARNPKIDIKNGLVGIDFGTASTVVVYQEESAQIHPMRIGATNLSEVKKSDYENPTIIGFENLTRFLQHYKAQAGRPKTQWNDVNISHTADRSDYPPNAILKKLKQWAGSKHQKLRIADKQKRHFDVPGSLDLKENDLNPIELYAYYLGLYINNQHHGIFLNYLLSFPVTYEVEVRQMILESFKKGIAKSLPNSLHAQGVVDQLNVEEGASEPAAYAIMALEGYGFEPSADERVYYGVFDFGGGTTDFDFGLFKEAPESSRYDYILEHFGAGGDRYLGGENLLELASFEVFKKNKDLLLQKHFPFKKPAEGVPFPGSEILLSESQEARANTETLIKELRPLWEGGEFKDEGMLKLNLVDSGGNPKAGESLDFNAQEILTLFKNRIKRGVENFFGEFMHATKAYFASKGDRAWDIRAFHIFLAGNASKSAFVTELFEEKITQIKTKMEQEGLQATEFIVHQPLSGEDLEKPNGKTGVAFGLIKARRGGSIQVIDYNVEENIKFKYFLGRSKKRKFYTLVARNQPYNEWVQFLDASESHFEVYYTSHASASTNTLSLEDSAIKKKALETGIISENAFIFVRLVGPSAFEFVVATEEGLKEQDYLTEISKVEL